jgi:uncharacterized alkaline shock family protein YloU
MDKPYSVTVKYSQTVKTFAGDIKEATDKVKKLLGVDESKFESVNCNVKQIPDKKVAEPEEVQKTRLPFRPKKGNYKEKN